MGLIPKIRRYCKDCAHFRGELNAQDRMLLAKMLERYGSELIVKSWLRLGQVRILSGKRLDAEKVRVAEIVGKEVLCHVERAMVRPVDAACYAWKPRE